MAATAGPTRGRSLLFNERRTLGELAAANAYVEGEVLAGRERRVDVNQVDLARELGKQRGQDVLLVSPYQAVAPFGGVAGGGEV